MFLITKVTSLSSSVSNKSHRMPLRSSNQAQEVDTCWDTSTTSKQDITSMLEPSCQFIEGPVTACTVDNSLYAIFQTWKLKCENTLEVLLASLQDAKNARLFLDRQVNKT